MTLLFMSFRFDRSYRNLANFTSIAGFRRVLPTLILVPLVPENFHNIEMLSCDIFAFLETFLAVFEVECLTHVCIERYVLAKYITNGWQIRKSHYDLYKYLCLFFACIYSVPPLFGIGRYSYDFDCVPCTFDILLPNTWQRYLIILIFVLRSIKPAVVMTIMLLWARVLERKLPSSMKSYGQFTKNVIVIAFANILCWTPIAVIRECIIFSQLTYLDIVPIFPRQYVMWAMWIHWMAPVVTAIALFIVDNNLRYKMLNIYKSTFIMETENKNQ